LSTKVTDLESGHMNAMSNERFVFLRYIVDLAHHEMRGSTIADKFLGSVAELLRCLREHYEMMDPQDSSRNRTQPYAAERNRTQPYVSENQRSSTGKTKVQARRGLRSGKGGGRLDGRAAPH
jgi:hypothetical protein